MCFKSTFKRFVGGEIANVTGERITLLCIILTKNLVTIYGCFGKTDILHMIIRRRTYHNFMGFKITSNICIRIATAAACNGQEILDIPEEAPNLVQRKTKQMTLYRTRLPSSSCKIKLVWLVHELEKLKE